MKLCCEEALDLYNRGEAEVMKNAKGEKGFYLKTECGLLKCQYCFNCGVRFSITFAKEALNEMRV